MTTTNGGRSAGRWGLLLVAAALLATGPGAAGQEISAALRDRAAQLLDRLESSEPPERDEAEAAIVKLGARVLPLLPAASDETPADLRERLDRIRAKLEDAEASRNLGASRVTIQGQGIRLSEVLRALQSQSGNRLTDLREVYGQDATNPALDLDLEGVPFLEALDRIAADAGLATEFYSGDGTIGLVAGGSMEGYPEASGGSAPVRYTGPFRVRLEQMAAQHDMTSGSRTANARMTVVWEPRLRPMLLALEASDVEIVDDRGETVAPTVQEESGTVVLRPDTPAAEFNLNMEAPAREAQSLARVKVHADVTVPAADKVFRLDLAEEKPEQSEDAVTVRVDGVQVDGFVWKVNVTIAYDGASEAFETYRQGLFNNEIFLQRPDGSRVRQNGGFNQLGASENALAFQYLFVDAPGKPADYTLVYETPGAVETIPLEFEFTDVPLP